jgi:hypothetical protein
LFDGKFFLLSGTKEPPMNETQQGSSGAQSSAAQDRTPILVLKKLDKRFGATHAQRPLILLSRGTKSMRSSAKMEPVSQH